MLFLFSLWTCRKVRWQWNIKTAKIPVGAEQNLRTRANKRALAEAEFLGEHHRSSRWIWKSFAWRFARFWGDRDQTEDLKNKTRIMNDKRVEPRGKTHHRKRLDGSGNHLEEGEIQVFHLNEVSNVYNSWNILCAVQDWAKTSPSD